VTVRIGLIGCGAVARRIHLPGFRASGIADVVAFAGGSPASATAAATEWGGGAVCENWREVLARADVDAVDICTPNSLHAEIAIAAAEAGKHVLVEKPIARTLAEADAMIAAARAAGVVMMTAHNVRFAPPFVAMRRAISQGRLGALRGFRAAFGHAGPEAWAPGAKWFLDPEAAGGGVLLDLGIHVADVLRAVLGEEIVEVAAMVTPGDVERAAQVALRTSSGALGSMHVSWDALPGPDHQLTVFGTAGTAHVDAFTPPWLRPAVGGDAEPLPLPEQTLDPYGEFARAVETGSPPPVSGEDGRAALAIIDAAYRAAATGTTQTVRGPA